MMMHLVTLHCVAWSHSYGEAAQQQAVSMQGSCAAAQGCCSKSLGPGNTL